MKMKFEKVVGDADTLAGMLLEIKGDSSNFTTGLAFFCENAVALFYNLS